MSILNKLSKIQIDPSKSLLKGEDSEFCKKMEMEYNFAYNFFQLSLEFININKESNTFLEFNDYIKSVELKTQALNKEFIEKIVWHFTEKYKISLDSEDVINKVFGEKGFRSYRSRFDYSEKKLQRKISLNEVLNPILESLGGMSLDEKAIKELKDKFYNNFAKIWNTTKFCELAKNRVEFKRGFNFESSYRGQTRYTTHSQKSAGTFFMGLSFFENGNIEMDPAFIFMNLSGDKYDAPIDLNSEIEFSLNKIKSVRFYKNGKSVVKFVSNEVAEEFFNEMCKGV